MTAWDLWLLGGGVMDVATSIHHSRSGERLTAQDYPPAVILAIVAVVALLGASSLRGFFHLTLMPIGAYKVASILTDLSRQQRYK